MDKDLDLAEAVKEACVRAAQQAYEEASISGLCDEGALEAALGAVRMVDVDEIVRAIKPTGT